ncbi:hypothetical protein G0A00_07895 [Yangia sp. PrR002]|nr:hypothetical protein [Salipiger sp. PrR002]NDW55697.1 hypothetical protein [Salipiger sp. PrR004]
MTDMEWQDTTRNWGLTVERLKARFPHIDEAALRARRHAHTETAQHIAARHDLTQQEATRELDDWAFANVLHRQIDRLAG